PAAHTAEAVVGARVSISPSAPTVTVVPRSLSHGLSVVRTISSSVAGLQATSAKAHMHPQVRPIFLDYARRLLRVDDLVVVDADRAARDLPECVVIRRFDVARREGEVALAARAAVIELALGVDRRLDVRPVARLDLRSRDRVRERTDER